MCPPKATPLLCQYPEDRTKFYNTNTIQTKIQEEHSILSYNRKKFSCLSKKPQKQKQKEKPKLFLLNKKNTI